MNCYCGKELEKDQVMYCSKSCAAKVNNVKTPKRRKTKKCKVCKSLIIAGRTYCAKCIKNDKHLHGIRVENRTLGELIVGKDSNRYCKIRQHARRIMKDEEQKCKICGYDVHVEACHKKDISDFPLDTLIKIINDRSNLEWLCRNHHWEFDHDLLKL